MVLVSLVGIFWLIIKFGENFPQLEVLTSWFQLMDKWPLWNQFLVGIPVIFLIGLMAFFVLFGFVSLMFLLGLLLAAFPFGVDAMFWNHFASTTAETSPLGTKPAQIFVAGGPTTPGLAHSGIYVHEETIQQIVDWIRSRSD